MTDRELLELAAKAAGIVGEWVKDKAFVQERWYFNVPYDNNNMLTGFEWNPLREDGDALRLAVKLGISLDRTSNRCWAFAAGMAINGVCEEFYGADPYAATRRAIVRAAAEIGRGHE